MADPYDDNRLYLIDDVNVIVLWRLSAHNGYRPVMSRENFFDGIVAGKVFLSETITPLPTESRSIPRFQYNKGFARRRGSPPSCFASSRSGGKSSRWKILSADQLNDEVGYL